MNREIKFRRVHFFDEDKTKFSHYTYWGIGIDKSEFTSPSSNNYALYYIDEQYTNLKDANGVEIYEGDILESHPKVHKPVIYKDGCFWWYDEPLGFEIEDSLNFEILNPITWATVIGNIHENKDLI